MYPFSDRLASLKAPFLSLKWKLLFRYTFENLKSCKVRSGIHTMGSFEDYCPKTQAWNLAPAYAILFQFKRFQILVHDPLFFYPWKQEFIEKEWKWSHKAKNSCPSFGIEFPKTGHSDSVTYPFILHSTPKQL